MTIAESVDLFMKYMDELFPTKEFKELTPDDIVQIETMVFSNDNE